MNKKPWKIDLIYRVTALLVNLAQEANECGFSISSRFYRAAIRDELLILQWSYFGLGLCVDIFLCFLVSR